MALKIDKRLLKFVGPPITEFVGAHLRGLEDYATALGLRSPFWQQSREAFLDPKKGCVPVGRFLDQCNEHILQVEEFKSNSVSAVWTMRNDAQEHAFKVKAVLSKIPHFWVDFLESSYEAGGFEAFSSENDKRKAVESGLADIVLTHAELLGRAHCLYLYPKVTRSKILLERFRDGAWSGEHVLGPIAEAAKRGLRSSGRIFAG